MFPNNFYNAPFFYNGVPFPSNGMNYGMPIQYHPSYFWNGAFYQTMEYPGEINQLQQMPTGISPVLNYSDIDNYVRLHFINV